MVTVLTVGYGIRWDASRLISGLQNVSKGYFADWMHPNYSYLQFVVASAQVELTFAVPG